MHPMHRSVARICSFVLAASLLVATPATWNTSSFPAGIYWIRAIINDGLGHTSQGPD